MKWAVDEVRMGPITVLVVKMVQLKSKSLSRVRAEMLISTLI